VYLVLFSVCIQEGDSLHAIAAMYGAHWLEMFAVNPALRGDPDAIHPGNLINVGVSLRVVRAQTLGVLARRLHTTAHDLRLLNPDIPNDDWSLKPFDRHVNISDTPETTPLSPHAMSYVVNIIGMTLT
jgi:hypothetical protein